MISSSDWTLPFYLYGGLTLGLFLVWHLLIYSNPHRNPHINPVERFYLDTEMSAIVDHKNKNIAFCRILCSLDVWFLSVIIGAYILMMLYLITDLRAYLSDVLRLHIGERGIWMAISFAIMIVTGFVMAIFSDWVVNSGQVNVVMMRKVCTNIGGMGPSVYTLAASYAGCDRQLSVVMFIIATALMGSSLARFRLIILEISPNYSGSVAAFCNCIG
ncbi:putative inorganic phosphate cotransporter, partial [Tenebrio molitor]|uniref:putative inorganic phosphate cotransporter n=1 Tax=Tenebrio molitor TaxID=7067 RepID=UPI003624A96B